MKTLSKETITQIIESSDNAVSALLGLFKEVMSPIEWDDIVSIDPCKIHTNKHTSIWIIEEMGRKWPDNKSGIAMLYLNKGFSAGHDNLKDWEVQIMDNCYTLKSKE